MEHTHGGLVQIIFLSNWVICTFHVNLPGCKAPESWPGFKRKESSSNHPLSGANCYSFREGKGLVFCGIMVVNTVDGSEIWRSPTEIYKTL